MQVFFIALKRPEVILTHSGVSFLPAALVNRPRYVPFQSIYHVSVVENPRRLQLATKGEDECIAAGERIAVLHWLRRVILNQAAQTPSE